MKIAMLTNNYKPFVGGVPISIERISEGLRKMDHIVTIFAPEYGQYRSNEVVEEKNVIRFQSYNYKMKNGIPYPKMFNKEILQVFRNEQKEKFDCIHVHHPFSVGITALCLRRKYKIPIVYTYHTKYENMLHNISFLCINENSGRIKRELVKIIKEDFLPQYMKWFMNQCDMVFAPSESIQSKLYSIGVHSKVYVMPTGIDDIFFTENRLRTKNIRKKFLGEIENEAFLFCSVSRLEEEKNLIFLLEGIRKLKEKLSTPFKVLLIGQGEMCDELKKEADRMRLSDIVIFTGNIANSKLPDYLRACDVFLFASKTETQGIVLEEAMAGGCPVIAVQSDGIKDVIQNGVNGFITEENVEDWSDRIVETCKKENLDRMKSNAEDTASSYQSSKLVARVQELYKQCIVNREEGNYETT